MKSNPLKMNPSWFLVPLIVLLVFVIFRMIGQGNRSPGKALYSEYCANCHMENGQGLGRVIPPLAGADYLKSNQKNLPCIILNGLRGEIEVNGETYDEPMAGIADLTAGQITNIINYISTSWGNDLPRLNLAEVKAAIEACNP